jgi:ADP-ribose pyrophosphatase
MSQAPQLTELNGQDDVELLDVKVIYQGFFRMDEYRFKHRLFDGNWSAEIKREVFDRGHAVAVLPYDPVTDQVVMIEQIRIPALATTKLIWLLELVAGMIAPGESPSEVATRELFEETGLKAKQLHKVSSYLASPGGSTERFYFYWAQVDASQASGIHGLEAENEDIRVRVLTRQHALDLLEQGLVDNAATVIGLQWLALNQHKLVEHLK